MFKTCILSIICMLKGKYKSYIFNKRMHNNYMKLKGSYLKAIIVLFFLKDNNLTDSKPHST